MCMLCIYCQESPSEIFQEIMILHFPFVLLFTHFRIHNLGPNFLKQILKMEEKYSFQCFLQAHRALLLSF